MPTKTEGTHALEFLLSEANGQRSREGVTTAAIGLVPGSIMENRNGAGWQALTDVALAATTVIGILCGPAVTGKVTIIRRDAEVYDNALVFPTLSTLTVAAVKARLADQGVIVR